MTSLFNTLKLAGLLFNGKTSNLAILFRVDISLVFTVSLLIISDFSYKY